MASKRTQELDFRSGDGLEVSLLWEPETNRVTVSVFDMKTGDDFEIEVAGHEADGRVQPPLRLRGEQGRPRSRRRISPRLSPRSRVSPHGAKELGDVTPEAFQQHRGSHGPLEREPLEDRSLRLARVRGRGACHRQHAWARSRSTTPTSTSVSRTRRIRSSTRVSPRPIRRQRSCSSGARTRSPSRPSTGRSSVRSSPRSRATRP